MDSDSLEDRLVGIQISKNDSVESTKELNEEKIPKILSPELHDVFHLFANMLDIKSFMKLAVTSKGMHKRCMEDKNIRINVDLQSVVARSKGLAVEYFYSTYGEHELPAVFQQLSCNVNVQTMIIRESHEQPAVPMESIIARLKEIGVNKIYELDIVHRTVDKEIIISIIKSFGVKSVNIYHHHFEGREMLRSLLQLNLEKLFFPDSISVDFILDVDSPVQKISLPGLRNISKEELMNIFSKVQSGPLHSLAVHPHAINWDNYDKLPFDHKGPLPDERPLLFAKPGKDSGTPEYWFLHWHGGVTKCATCYENVEKWGTLRISKCEPWEYPQILRKKEDILNDLAKCLRVSCTEEQFRTFLRTLTTIGHCHEGPLSDHRPLYFDVNENHFWMLDEDDILKKCTWKDGYAVWKSAASESYVHDGINNKALIKYLFWKHIKEETHGTIFYYNELDFDSWFENVEVLDFEYSGSLPSTRPLVFEKTSSDQKKLRVVLLEERIRKCEFFAYAFSGGFGASRPNHVEIGVCDYLTVPPLLQTGTFVVEALKAKHYRETSIQVNFESFRDGLKQFKKSTFALQKRIPIFEKTETEIWIGVDTFIRKVTWKEGRLSLIYGDSLLECPLQFVKQAFRYFVDHQFHEYCKSFTLSLEQFRSCLEQFTIVPFDHSGPLTSDSPIGFMKEEIRHTCYGRRSDVAPCRCSDVVIEVQFLWDSRRLVECTWGKNGRKEIWIDAGSSYNPPLMLKTSEHLKNLLQANYEKKARFSWNGRFEDFLENLVGYVKLPFNYNDWPLPTERPLLFDEDPDEHGCDSYSIVRKDGTIIQCLYRNGDVVLYTASYQHFLPPILRNAVEA